MFVRFWLWSRRSLERYHLPGLERVAYRDDRLHPKVGSDAPRVAVCIVAMFAAQKEHTCELGWSGTSTASFPAAWASHLVKTNMLLQQSP